ncbi:MAG: hypothetical protein SFY69_07855 [Planctomycetota bacterium]|nr:hypothetical protein [Planctomycetota bacterium]
MRTGSTPPEIPAREAFRPSVHGLRFVNRFSGSPLPDALRGSSLARGKVVPAEFGLCGGMSLLVADYYLAGQRPPDDTTPPAPGTPLYDAIAARQLESFGEGGVMVLAFRRWMSLPDDGGADEESTASLTRAELAGILRRLDRGELVPLGLVYVRSRTNSRAPQSRVGVLWQNHQVLAYGYEPGEAGVRVRVYDPNYPGDDGVVIAPAQGVWERRTGTGKVTRVRGFFPMPYEARPAGG